jgi:hypothetical protein
MTTTKKQSLKAFNATESKVMVKYIFDVPMYLKEAVSIFARPTLTPNIDEALVWGAMDSPSKLSYNTILVGLQQGELEFLSIK